MTERPTSPELAQLSADQRNRMIEAAHEGARLTPDEERRREIAREFAPTDVWGATASSCLVLIVESYRRGEVDMRSALAAMQRVSVGATTQARLTLLGLTAACLLQIEPAKKGQGQRKPDWPLWLKTATADLIIVQQRHSPDERLTPSPHYAERESSPLIDYALDTLTKIGWYDPDKIPTQRTVYEWVRARLKEKPADQ